MPVVRAAALGLLLLAAGAQAQTETVRVRVIEGAATSQVEVEAVGVPGALWVDGVQAGTLEPGATVALSRSGGQVRIRFDGSDLSGREVRVDAPEIRVVAGQTRRRYPARLAVTVAGGRLLIVNHAPLETYVASVVASELGFAVPEAVKAQAVLARTYATRRAGQFAAYDLDDDQRSQVYRGLDTITAGSADAARQTHGQILTYRGEIADAYYFSSSGGHTADNESIWRGAPVPYLRGVPDPFDDAAPDHAWRTTASRGAVLRALSTRYGGDVRDVEVDRRSAKGRVLAVRLVGGRTGTITGDQLRQTVNATAGARTVRSTRYSVSTDGDALVFTGGGYGHGVGMSQYGAMGQARAGRSYRDILAHYFVGTDVSGGTPGGFSPSPAFADAPAANVPAADIPREPVSALRTRYQPPSGRRWPTPRRAVPAEDGSDTTAQTPPAATPPRAEALRPARRTAW